MISRYLDIVLESGLGPTVQEAFKKPSALFHSHTAICPDVRTRGRISSECYRGSYRKNIQRFRMRHGQFTRLRVAVGDSRACQQQTAVFQWAYLYESVERKIEKAPKTNDAMRAQWKISGPPATKKRKTTKTPFPVPLTVADRSLPFPVLQALIMWLRSLQNFPEHQLLHLRCDKGISTVVVWCHHVLGLAVTVRSEHSEIRIGSGNANVLVEESDLQHAGATLMNPAEQNEPLFDLANDEDSPYMSHEIRAEAFGYGVKFLRHNAIPDTAIEYCTHWIIGRSLVRLRDDGISSVGSPQSSTTQSPHQQYPARTRYPSENHLLQAARFIFAMDAIDMDKVKNYANIPAKRPSTRQSSTGNLFVPS